VRIVIIRRVTVVRKTIRPKVAMMGRTNNDENNTEDGNYNDEEGVHNDGKKQDVTDYGDNYESVRQLKFPEVWSFNPPGPRITPVWEYVVIPRETTMRAADTLGIAVYVTGAVRVRAL
jgi:hypothetical protein